MVAAVPHDLRPARRRHRRIHLGPGPRPSRRPLLEDHSADGRRQDRSPRLHRVPTSPPGEGVVNQPTREAEQRSQATRTLGRHLPNEASVIPSPAPCSPTPTTSGKPEIATSPKAQWPSSTPSAILTTSPNSTAATDTEDHLQLHHSVGRSHGSRYSASFPGMPAATTSS